MDAPRDTDITLEGLAADTTEVDKTSLEFLGRWSRLVSTTNREKGRIICQWREALIDTAAETQSYSDEAWSRRVGNISPQHVGRLRRVYQRFGTEYEQYPGLYWSHFQAALEWHDAEMWLEGAVQNGWSVARMRHQRWETLGGGEDQKPDDQDIVAAELDEDVSPADDSSPETIPELLGVVRDPQADDKPTLAESPLIDEPVEPPAVESSDESGMPDEDSASVGPVRPFENVPSLPSDLNEAFETFKLAILNHKVSGWREISCQDVLVALEALKQLVLAPADS